MQMRHVEQMKRRMIRQAIQRNLEVGRLKRANIRVRARNLPRLWAPFLIASAVFAIPRFVISTDSKAPLPAASTITTTRRPISDAATTQPNISLSPPNVIDRAIMPLSVKRIVIDPGHGGEQVGAISKTGVTEKEITLDIALRLRRLMDQSPFEAIMTREADETVSLEKRVELANSIHADLFVSIHVNWVKPHSIHPLETYYVGPTEDSEAIELATYENRQSGYSLSEYRELLDKIYLDTRRNESRLLAQTLNAELYNALRPLNPDLQDRGIKMAPFAVLMGTQMPAVLAEVSALSNQEDVRLLQDEQYRQQIAIALLKGIRSYANKLSRSGTRGSQHGG